ncbi:MAG: XkdF-like putative serine protease domain-containing protein [Bryobacteraceae bacterium]
MTDNIVKIDTEQQLVFGWASVVFDQDGPVVDRQGDVIDASELEKAAYAYVLESRVGGEMHRTTGVAKLVESIVFTKQKQEALGIDLGKTGWWVGFKVTDPDVWAKVKKGELRSFSIHGKARRV